ncbi:MAG: tetraacyldisaccharide 4'-kinase [Sedimentisphaerales bacterium]
MNYEQSHRRIISGQSTGSFPALLRCLLQVAAVGYSLVVRLRNSLYSKEWLKTRHVDAAVICVGNITTGGTGKTPLVASVYKTIVSNSRFQISNSQCAILTRGYKAAENSGNRMQGYSDEIAVLVESCPGAKVIVNPDRVAGATEAINKYGAKVLIMDDGFQHRRLARDLDIVTIDATQPFGYDKMLPAGLLREPVASLKRAQAIVITRCDQITQADLDELERQLRSIHPDMVVARSIHAPVCVRSADQNCIDMEELRGKRVFAFCGIGNPEAFLDTVRSPGCELVGSEFYSDHYHYTNDSLANVCSQAKRLAADLILTTQKDWTKVSRLATATRSPPLAYLVVEMRFLTGEDQLTALIEDALQGRIPERPGDGLK